jgi:hypothetical protein
MDIDIAAHDPTGEIIMIRHASSGKAANHGRPSSKHIVRNSTMTELGSPVRAPISRARLAVLQQKRRKARIS